MQITIVQALCKQEILTHVNKREYSLPKRPALFLDRDGVINVDRGYVDTPDGFEFVPGAIETIAAFNKANWYVFVVTNQTGIAHGHYTEEDMFRVHAYMQSQLSKYNASIDRIYYCPYDIRGSVTRYCIESEDRKPASGMLRKAMKDFPTIKEASFLIGDKPTDITAAQGAGIKSYLFKENNLLEFVQSIEDENIQNVFKAAC